MIGIMTFSLSNIHGMESAQRAAPQLVDHGARNVRDDFTLRPGGTLYHFSVREEVLGPQWRLWPSDGADRFFQPFASVATLVVGSLL